MREIKFRAISLYGKMIHSYDLIRRHDWIEEKWIDRYFMQDGYSCNITPKINDFVEVDPKTIEEYTGHKDKNDIEVYGGDVWERDGFIGVVEFKFAQWSINHLPSSNSIQYPAFYSNAKTGIIIANIYENPELLNK